MSTAVMSSPIFDCGELFKSGGTTKAKDSLQATLGQAAAGGHAPLRRSYTSLVNLIEQHRKLDRTVSEPTSRYKTELCRPFEENGSCKYGDKCQFAHGYSELRNLARHPKYKTELCRTFHKIGFCPYGPRCHFVHNFEEARIHNLKVSAQLGQPQLGPLLSPASVGLLEQLAASAGPLALQSPLSSPMASPMASPMPAPRQPLHRSHSLGVAPLPIAPLAPLGPLAPLAPLAPLLSRPKPLNLSPTFSLGSAADSSSPSSSLSQSPTNSMASFFSDEAAQGLGFPQELSPSPQSALPEELASPRTPSPLSPGADSRLPVFNRISSTLPDLEHLKI